MVQLCRQTFLSIRRDDSRIFAIRASISLMSSHPNRPRFFIFGFMVSGALKPSKARFGFNMSRLFLIASLSSPDLSLAIDCHLTVSAFWHKRQPSLLKRDSFIFTY